MRSHGRQRFQTNSNNIKQKKCKLIRLPTVSTSTKPTKKEVLMTKSIASLRIHIKRVIRRIREYKILQPFACVDWNLTPYIDDCAVIVAGLVNLQTPIIRK